MRSAAILGIALLCQLATALPLHAEGFVATDSDVSSLMTAGEAMSAPAMLDSEGEEEGGYGAAACSDQFGEPCFAGECADPSITPGTEVPAACRDLWDQMNSCYKIWVRTEYLNWSVKGDTLPALLTTSPPGTPQGVAGLLGEPTTTVLFPTAPVNEGARPGGRIQVGWWFDQGETNGLQADYFILQKQAQSYNISSPNDPILARPFFNPVTGLQDASYIAFPNFQVLQSTANLAGSFSAIETSQAQSFSLLWRRLLWVNCNRFFWHRWHFTGGYRYFQLNENLTINDVVTPTGGPFVDGTRISSVDQFVTSTTFNGLDLGLYGDIHRGRFSCELVGRLAMGNSHQVQSIAGKRTVFDTVTTVVNEGGLLAEPTNIGKHAYDGFALMPEGSVTLGMQITSNLKATVGYSFLYVNRVTRPGNSIDYVVNPTQIGGSPLVGPARPAPTYSSTDIWLQGVSVGLDFRY
ncbi:MAG: BBP7 family outer membrane beta-barrel protein [Planctomycetaceae bacterium]|nr:BBP7 family outer membrane beta-barrel protein [Planctomycetaceae bacterium]